MNLQQAKELFLAQHLNTNVIVLPCFMSRDPDKKCKTSVLTTDLLHAHRDNQSYLQLRTVSQLTDEELEVFAKQSAYRLDEKNKSKIGKVMVDHLFELNKWSGSTILFLTDYLRSIGILLPFTFINNEGKPETKSEEEIIALGWAKLKY